MKKVLTIIIIILMVILIILTFQSNTIKYNTKMFLHNIFAIDNEIKYSNMIKVNNLSISTSDYYYSKLDEFEKQIYTSIIFAIKDYEEEVIITGFNNNLIQEELNKKIEYVMNNIFLDHPEIYYVSPEYTMYTSVENLFNGIIIKLNYIYDSKEKMLKEHEKINNEIDNILLNIKGGNEYELELAIHDYVAKNINYTIIKDEKLISKNSHNIYNPLIKKEGVCDGLSKTLQILLDKVGIESILVIGKTDNVAHGWLMVNIDNNWYNLDVTGNKYIADEKNNVEFVSHTYFNVTTESIKETHKFDNENLLPIANSITNNYYEKEGYTLNINENFSRNIKNIYERQNDKLYIEFFSNYDKNIISKVLEELRKTSYINKQILKNNEKIKYYKQGKVYTIKNN